MSGFFNGGEFFLPLVMLINTAVVCFFVVLLLLALAVLRESLRRMRAEWTRMEIR
jgi:hypothetical protein